MFISMSVGVGEPSVFVLLSLVNKETALGLVILQNLGRRGGRTEFWEEESRVREPLWRCQLRRAESFPVSHKLVVIYRLLKMG